jgi:hypothetical protein
MRYFTISSNTTKYDTESLETWAEELSQRYATQFEVAKPMRSVQAEVLYFASASAESPVKFKEPFNLSYTRLSVGDTKRIYSSPMEQLTSSIREDAQVLPLRFYHDLSQRMMTMMGQYVYYWKDGHKCRTNDIVEAMLNEGFKITVLGNENVSKKEARNIKKSSDLLSRQKTSLRHLAGYAESHQRLWEDVEAIMTRLVDTRRALRALGQDTSQSDGVLEKVRAQISENLKRCTDIVNKDLSCDINDEGAEQ